jgi:predicted RNA-binding protein YlxR (DUF448 family)
LAEPAYMAETAIDEPENEAMVGLDRRCFVTGSVRPTAELLRFVVDPAGRIVPDVAHRLPGRGLWLTARRDIVREAVGKRLFARAAKAPVAVEAGIEDRIEALLARRCAELLGLARRAGLVRAGFVKVKIALAQGEVAVLVSATDGAADGRAKLGLAAAGTALVVCLSSGELSAALGREHAVHVAVKPGRLADLFLTEARRLAGFRAGARVDVIER